VYKEVFMKVLLVNGGPHKNGSINRALCEIRDTLKEEGIDSEIFWIGTDAIAGCIGCASCRKTGKCFRNDIVNEFCERANDFDGFIFGSPVHYAAISGALSAFMDRVFYSRSSAFYMKPAAGIVSCRRGGATAAFDELNKYFTISGMPVVSSQYWNQIHGTNAEEAERDGEGLQTMRTLARNMAYILKCLEAGKKEGINPPKKEAGIRTNFITPEH
jgi:multimeric flavodoxin WrbA